MSLCLPAIASAQTKLNATLARSNLSSVAGMEFSPDGATLVYLSDASVDERFELFAVPVDGSAGPILLSGTLVEGGDVSVPTGSTALPHTAFEVSPDSSWVAFLADANVDGVHELLRAPLDGSLPPIVLASPSIQAGDVFSFAISPDGAFVVALADGAVDERFELWRVPADGSAPPTSISGSLVAGGDVGTYSISADSARLFYLADAVLDGVTELFSTTLATPTPAVRLNPALGAGRNVSSFAASPDGARVVFRADVGTDDVYELHSVPAGGGPSLRLDSGTTSVGLFGIVLDQSVVFLQGTTATALYSAPLDGSGTPLQLSDPGENAVKFWTSPDGATVLYSSRAGTQMDSLRAVPIGGGSSLTLATPAGANHVLKWVEVAPSGDWLVFTWEKSVPSGGFSFYENIRRVSLAGGPVLPLTQLEESGLSFGVTSLRLIDEGRYALYTRTERKDGQRIHVVATDGSGSDQVIACSGRLVLSPDLSHLAFTSEIGPDARRLTVADSPGTAQWFVGPPALKGAVIGDVVSFATTPDDLQVVYVTSTADTPGLAQAFVVGSGGGTQARALWPEDEYYEIKSGPILSPRSDRAAFVLRELYQTGVVLRTFPLRGGAPQMAVEAPADTGASYGFVQALFTPDGRELVYAAFEAEHAIALHCVASDGSAAPRRLNGLLEDRAVTSVSLAGLGDAPFALTPDGVRVVYAARATATGISPENLFSVHLELGAEPVRLSDFDHASTRVYTNWRITPDGSRVAYIAEVSSGSGALFSVPVDGGASPVRLSPTPVAGGSVLGYGAQGGFRRHTALTGDGSRVLYLADQDVDERVELYSVPLDGGAPSVKVSGTLIPGGDVSPLLELTPDSTRVLFRADKGIDGTPELYSAPVDGSALPVRLSGTTIGPVVSYPDSSGVRSGAGQTAFVLQHGGGTHLYSRPDDGSLLRVRLDPGLPDSEIVMFDTGHVTAQGMVFFRTQSGRVLVRVPIDGSAALEQIGPPVQTGRAVQRDFIVSASGRRVFWRIDQEADEQFDLYTLALEPRTPRGPAVPPPISRTVTRGL